MRSFHPAYAGEILETEYWKPLVGFEAVYEISSLGRVRRVKPRGGAAPGRPLKWGLSHDGYPQVFLSAGGEYLTLEVHTLVALTFIGPRPSGHQVRHLDGDKLNASASNLEYRPAEGGHVPAAKNSQKGAKGERHWKARLKEEDVVAIRTKAESIKATAKRYGLSITQVKKIRSNKAWRNVR